MITLNEQQMMQRPKGKKKGSLKLKELKNNKKTQTMDKNMFPEIGEECTLIMHYDIFRTDVVKQKCCMQSHQSHRFEK